MNKLLKTINYQISEEKIKKILKIKEGLVIAGIDEKDIAIMSEQIHPIAYGTEKSVIFTEIAGIPVIEIIGTGEEN